MTVVVVVALGTVVVGAGVSGTLIGGDGFGSGVSAIWIGDCLCLGSGGSRDDRHLGGKARRLRRGSRAQDVGRAVPSRRGEESSWWRERERGATSRLGKLGGLENARG